MSDPVEEGLRKTEAELEELARRLSPQPVETPTRTSPLAHDAAFLISDLLGAGIRGFLDRPRLPRPSRFTSRSAPVAPREIPRAASSPPVAPFPTITSIESRVEVVAPASSVRFGEDHLEDRAGRLNLEPHDGPRESRKLRGPIIA